MYLGKENQKKEGKERIKSEKKKSLFIKILCIK